MLRCTDPLVGMLKRHGFNLVSTPRPDIVPLQILAKSGRRLEQVGHLKDLFVRGNSVSMPRKSRDTYIAKELQNQKTLGIKSQLGIDILKNFLKPMKDKNKDKGKTPKKKDKANDGTNNFTMGFGIVFENVDKFIFSYQNVYQNDVNIIRLDEFINDARPNYKAKAMVEKMKKNQLYIVTATLKSNSFSTEFVDKNNASINVGIPQIRGVIGGEIGLGYDKENSNKIVYENDKQLIFGFKAVKILFDKETRNFSLKSSKGIVLRDEEDFPTEAYLPKSAFVDLGE